MGEKRSFTAFSAWDRQRSGSYPKDDRYANNRPLPRFERLPPFKEKRPDCRVLGQRYRD